MLSWHDQGLPAFGALRKDSGVRAPAAAVKRTYVRPALGMALTLFSYQVPITSKIATLLTPC